MAFLVDICPACNKQTIYCANPMYMHICKHCGHECGKSDLKRGILADKVRDEIKRLQSILNDENFIHVDVESESRPTGPIEY